MKSLPLALLILMSLSFTSYGSSDPGAREAVLADFSESSAAAAWRVVNDDVMGGISRGRIAVDQGRLVFTGETRLENNGGFASIRSRPRDWKLGGARELMLRMRGTASREYTMLLRSDATWRGRTVSYRLPFRLKGEEWQTVRLPLDRFRPAWRGRKLDGPALEPAKVQMLGLMVADKKAAPFEVEIDWIKAVWNEASVPTKAGAASRTPSIAEIAAGDKRFSTLLAAVKAAGLAERLSGAGEFTVLAPTNAAFAKLPKGTVESLLEPANRERLQAILLHHVIPGTQSADQLVQARQAKTAQGEAVRFGIRQGRLVANDAKVILNDVSASNGVIHAIDSVLIPEELPAADPATRLLEMAVDRGAPLFNDGQIDACVAIYEVALTAVVDLPGSRLDDATRDQLRQVIRAARQEEDARASAWALRRGLDAAWRKLR